MKEKKSKSACLLYVISLAVLFLYPLRHVRLGVDLMDGGYNYANFAYHDLEYMDSMWYFATWTANTLGSLLRKLPWGGSMLGMNVYTGLVISVITAASYVFCVRKLHLPHWLTFAGEMLAVSLCWAPSAVLYNYLTYGLLFAGTVLLYEGLTTGRKQYLVLAGAALGMNVGVRFSNLVQMGLILVVWYDAYLCKKNRRKVLQETLLCILGYAGAFALFLIHIAVKYGLSDYLESIRRLFAMTEHATDYSAQSMLLGFGKAYLEDTSTYWLKRFGLAGVICLAACILLPRGWTRVKQILTVLLTALFMVWIVKKGYCTADYTTYGSIYYPAIMILLMAMVLSFYWMLQKDADRKEKLQAIIVPLTLYLTSLGGNNAIYSSMNNLFLVMPCFLWMAYRFWREKKHILYFPFQTFLAAGILLLFWQGVCFGSGFVYEGATGARDLSTQITAIPVLKGMYTGDRQAGELEELYSCLEQNDLIGRKVILYGDIPGIAYFMELPPAINVWSDLRSYSPDTMEADLQRLEREIAATGEYPIVILEQKTAACYRVGEGLLLEELPREESTAKKLMYICQFMQQEEYQCLAETSNGKFTVYSKK